MAGAMNSFLMRIRYWAGQRNRGRGSGHGDYHGTRVRHLPSRGQRHAAGGCCDDLAAAEPCVCRGPGSLCSERGAGKGVPPHMCAGLARARYVVGS